MKFAIRLLGAIALLTTSGCFTYLAATTGMKHERPFQLESVCFDDSERVLEIVYSAWLQRPGDVRIEERADIRATRVVRIAYGEFHYFRLCSQSEFNPTVARLALLPARSSRYPHGLENDLKSADAILPSNASDKSPVIVKRGEGATYLEFTKVEIAGDEEIVTAIKKGRAAFVWRVSSPSAVFIPKDDDVLVVFLPERTDSRPWAPYARVALVPLGIVADIVCLPVYAVTLLVAGILSLGGD